MKESGRVHGRSDEGTRDPVDARCAMEMWELQLVTTVLQTFLIGLYSPWD